MYVHHDSSKQKAEREMGRWEEEEEEQPNVCCVRLRQRSEALQTPIVASKAYRMIKPGYNPNFVTLWCVCLLRRSVRGG